MRQPGWVGLGGRYSHAGINGAVRDVANGWNHCYILRHVVSDFNEKYKNKVLKDLAYQAACQH